MVIPNNSFVATAGDDAQVVLSNFTTAVGGLDVGIGSAPIKVPKGATLLVLPQAEPAAAQPPEPGS